jgi:hypothetical protein
MLTHVEVAESGEGRTQPREPVATVASVRGDDVRVVAAVSDFSPEGVRLVTASLQLPLLEKIRATVVWVVDCECGCKFDEPVPASIFQVTLRSFR